MERVLKAVPADLRVKMEALVHDLTLALEESSNSANLRRRWGIRRRARSTGNIRKCEGQIVVTLKIRSNTRVETIEAPLSVLIAPAQRLLAVYLREAHSWDYYQDYLCRNQISTA